MRRFLLHIALFCAAFLPAYLLGIRLIGGTPLHGNISYVPANYGHMRSRLAEADTIGPVDVLFLGSSHCYRTFDPRPYADEGIRVFNLGSSNQTPIQTLALLETYIDQLNPRQVIFEVHPDILGLDGVESACDLLSNRPLNPPLLRMLWKLMAPRAFNTALYARMRNDYLGEDSIICVGTDVNGEQLPCNFTYIAGGFVQMPLVRYIPKEHTQECITFNSKQLQALNDCLSLLKERSIPVRLVEVPSAQCLYQAYSNHADFEATMQATGCEYLNLNGRIPLVDSLHFFDHDHLNQEGVEIVNKYLIQCVL